MQDNINNTNHPDAFSEILKQKLENHPSPVDAGSWSAIEKGLKPKRKKIVWWMWIPIGSAAVLALLFTLRPMLETPNYTSKTDTETIQQAIIETNKEKEAVTAKLTTKKIKKAKINADKTAVKQILNEETIYSKNEIATTQIEVAQVFTVIIDTINEINTKEQNYTPLSGTENLAQNARANEDSVAYNDPKNVFRNSLIDEPTKDKKTKQKHGWLLAAAFGSGGSGESSLFGNSEMYSDAIPEKLVTATPTYTTILTTNDFTSIIHSPPVSFGLVVRKNLDNIWSVESGLVYTYLLSTFDNQNMQRSDAKLHLHYVGIPVSLVAKVWKNQKWDVYIAAGAMVEKGIQSNYIQNQYFGNQTYTTTVKSDINGVQGSLNSAIGASYKLQRNLGIYFEPKISYYLENNQPMSARTEHPLIIGFNAGLRFEL